MSHVVAKPKTATDGVVELIIHPLAADAQGVPADQLFRVSVASASLGFSVQVADITADDDTEAVYTHNEMTRGTFQVQGYALGSDDIGIANLQSTNNGKLTTSNNTVGSNPVQPYDIQFNWANSRYIRGMAIIEQIQVSYSRSSAFVGVSIAGRFTSTDFSQEAVVG